MDECLSLLLANLAIEAGYPESAHVTHRGMKSWRDPRLMRAIVDGDWTFVTRNSDDFRPKPGSQSLAPCYSGQSVHAGLVCLNLPKDSRYAEQRIYFQAALDRIGNPGDLINQILEVDPDDEVEEGVTVHVYEFPRESI